MQTILRLALASTAATVLLAGCYYAPVMQGSYPFAQHPGVFTEVWWQYDAYGAGYTVTNIVNRSSVDKCAWTAAQDSRLLRSGEMWQVQSPGAVGIANVLPTDPGCANAKRSYGTPAS